MSIQESSRTSEDDSLVQSSSIITYNDIADSSIVDTSIINNNEKAKQGKVSPFYHRRRFWAMCVAVNVVLAAIFLPLLYFVIIPAAAQGAINSSKFDLQSINITNVTDEDCMVSMSGHSTGSGPFSAKLEFEKPVTVSFNNKKLGSVVLENFSVSGGKGSVNSNNKKLIIENQQQFTDFASTTLTQPTFTWNIQGSVNIRTFGIKIKNLKLNKDITIPGSNNFSNSSVLNLEVNQNPDKSLSLNILTSLYNPSPISIELGDMYFDIIYNGTNIGSALSKGVVIKSKDNTLAITANAKLPTNDADRYNYLKVIESYLTNNPISAGVKVNSIISPNGKKVDWINNAAKNLHLTSVVGQTKAPQIITGVNFGQMSLKFSADAPFAPTVSAKNATAQFTLPFNIDFKILTVKQKISIVYKGNTVSTFETPEINVTSTPTELSLDIPEIQMVVEDDQKTSFQDFLKDLTTSSGIDVNIVGTTDSRINTVIGDNLLIQGLPVNLTTTLQGFDQFIGAGGSPPAVNDLTILAGTANELVVGVVVTLNNPSQYSTSIGQVAFNVFYREQQIGTAVIQDLNVVPGPNPLSVVIILNDPVHTAGKDILTSFLTGRSVTVDIRGFDGSTNITSLIPAFKAIDIQSTIAPIQQQLVSSSKLVINNQTSATTGDVQLANTYAAPISIYTLSSTFNYKESVLGSVGQDMQNNPIFIPGNSIQDLQLPVVMKPDPVASFSMVRDLAIQNGMDVSVFDSLIALSKVDVPGVDPNVQPTPEAIKSFDLPKFLTTALAKIPVNVNMESRVAIGYYFMDIAYQQNITVQTDTSILGLIPTLAQPLISQLSDQSQMNIDSMFIYNIDVFSFDVNATGSISNTGPLPAQINFPDGILVSSNGVLLGKIVNIPTITADPIAGATLSGVSSFQIADTTTFTSFTESMLTAPSFTGDIETDVVFTSFGIPIGPFHVKKSLNLGGFSNALQQQVQVVGFTIPTPENPEFAAKLALNNSVGFGIELGTVVFNLFMNNRQITTITGDSITILPKSVSTIEFHGPLDLTNMDILNGILSKSPITAQGVSVKPPKATGDVIWLSQTIQSFQMTVPFDLSALSHPSSPPPQK